jgi:hypothetical protein
MASTGLCKHRWIFGKEGEGAHSLRLFDVAVVDVVFTLAGAALLAAATGGGGGGWGLPGSPVLRFAAFAASLFLLGIALHRLFCVNTTVNKAIFGVVGERDCVERGC